MDYMQREIDIAKGEGLDTYYMTCHNYRDSWQLEQIRLGLEDNLNVSVYANDNFTWAQMEQLRLGLKDNLNVEVFANPNYSFKQMDAIRRCMKSGLDFKSLLKPNLLHSEVMELYNKICQNK